MNKPSSPLLTIAGFDPSSGAGVTADLAVFAAHGFFGISAITALTVQSTLGVRSSQPVDAPVLAATLDCLERDLPAAGIKIGMLATEENVRIVAGFLKQKRTLGQTPVVLDPVLVSSSGKELLSAAGLQLLREELLAEVDWITPNQQELAHLLGRTLSRREDLEAGARELASRFAGLGVVVTGGDTDLAEDFVYSASGASGWLRGTRILSNATHGTGCAFSSALLCALVGESGLEGLEAAKEAKEYVAQAIRTAVPRGAGKGPMNLLWRLDREA